MFTNYFASTVDALLSGAGAGFTQTSMKSPLYPGYIAIGDINGDGKPDIAGACVSQVGIYFNGGSGTFEKVLKLSIPSELAYGGFALTGDLNGDGIVDIADESDASVSVFLGEGTERFAAPFFLGTGNDQYGFYEFNLHGQNPKQGTPDLVEMDGTGVIYTLINETK